MKHFGDNQRDLTGPLSSEQTQGGGQKRLLFRPLTHSDRKQRWYVLMRIPSTMRRRPRPVVSHKLCALSIVVLQFQ